MKHTPGPWRIGTSSGPLKELGFNDPPAIYGKNNNSVLAILGGGSIHFENAKANARLIAAAPDLLEACEQALALDWFPHNDPGDCLTNDGCPVCQTLAFLRRSIAKAKGE